ncbi:hypothetical protein Trydic_g16043 [Trypoxylus dichotomus]
MTSGFSSDGQFFALLSSEGKLKIWNTITGSFEQEYSPDYHLSCPCTCLQFIASHSSSNKNQSPKKKKRRESLEASKAYIILGTTTGVLLGYSIANASVTFKINSKINQEITSLSWSGGSTVYSSANHTILSWDLQHQILKDKWNCGNDKITAIKEISDNKMLVAAKVIRLVNINDKEIIRTFTGHSSDICLLEYVNLTTNSDAYFISGSKSERLLNCWTLNEENPEKNAIASFIMDDVAQNISVINGSNSTTNMAALTRSGLVHIYQHVLNGKCNKPIKPKTTIQVASDMGENVVPIPIIGAQFQKDLSLLICHGSQFFLTFENITVNIQEKVQCLTPLVENNVQYLTPHTSAPSAVKRKPDGTQEMPMEQRLENLRLTKSDITSKVPKMGNVAQLLIQGLHSKDKHILRNVLIKRDESIIRNTINRLPMPVIVPLLEELTHFVQGKTAMSYIGSLWLKHLLQIHAALLFSNPQLSQLLDPVLESIQSRLLLQTPLSRLRGRLDLLMSQINNTTAQENNENDEPLLSYVDKDSSDSEIEIQNEAQSESENEWTEEECDDNEKSDASEGDDQDSEMST